MTEFVKRHKKLISVVTFLFLLFFGGIYTIKHNLPKTVEILTGAFLGPKFKSSDIIFEKNKIIVKDFILQDKDEVIIKSPEVDILYTKESLKNLRIKEIIVNGGEANITRRKNGDVNVVAAFTGGSDDKPEKEEKKEKKYEPGISVPIDKITGKDITTIYRDYSYRLPIEKIAYNTNGFMTFSKTEGIDLNFRGTNKKEVFDFSFNNSKEPYSMTIKLANIGVTTELAQYGYDGDEISYNGGTLNMDLTIATSGLLGWLNFDGVDLRYKDLDDTIKNVSGEGKFNKEGIFIDATGLVFGKDEKFSLSYKNEELNIDFALENIQQKNIEKLSYLKGIDLPFNDLVVNKMKFNLNMKKELKITIDGFVKKLNIDNISLQNTGLKFIYDNGGMHIDNLNSDILVLDDKKKELIKEKLSANLDLDKENNGNVIFSLINTNDKKYIPNLEGNAKFSMDKEKIDFNFNSNILNLKGKYLSKDEKLVLEDKMYYLEYDIKNRNYVKGKGEFLISLLDNKFSIDFSGEKNIFKIDNFSVENKLETTKKLFSGEIDLGTMSYDFNFSGEKLALQNFLTDNKSPLFSGALKGNIQGNKENINAKLEIQDLLVEYPVKVSGVNGKLDLNKSKNLDVDFAGEIGKIAYNNYSIDGILAVFRMKNENLEIKTLQNGFINFAGNIDLKKEKLDIVGNINNLPLSKLDIENPNILIENAGAKFYGDLNNPKGQVDIKNISVEINDGQPILIGGKIDFSNGKFYTDTLKINNSIVKGEYLVDKKRYSAKVTIIEEDIGKYYGDTNLKYRVIGTLLLNGQDKEINASLKSTLDKIYIQGRHLPNVYLETSYKSKDLLNGSLIIDDIILSNSDLQNILNLNGKFDLNNKVLKLDLPTQEVELVKLKEYIPIEDIKGSIVIAGDVTGPIDDLKYKLNTSSDKIIIEGVEFDKLKIAVTGNLEEAKLDEFSFRYMENLFYSTGNYNLKTQKYKYNASSKKINLSFLNIFLNEYKIENITGEAVFDLELANNKNTGFLTITNFGLEKKDLFLKLTDFNSTIRLAGSRLFTDSLTGNFNDGTVFFKGSISIPTLNEIADNPYFYENLTYNADLELRNIKYKYGKYFNLDLNTDLSFKNNNLFGQVEILKGEVFEIPTKSESIFEKIRKFLFSSASKTVNDSESLGKDFKIDTVFDNSINVNIGLKIVDGIKLDIDTLVSMVTDIQGNILGSGIITGSNGKYLFLGNIEAIGGSLNVNDNTFVIERAILAFNDRKTYFPKINPNVLIDASVDVKNDRIGLALNGTLDNLQFNINSKNGSSSGSLNSLLVGDGDGQDNNDATAALLTNLIGGQFTQIIRPISNLVKNTLGLSKFRIASNFLTEDSQNGYNSERQSRIRLGAVLEAEDNIYKDKIWWVAKATLLEEDSEQTGNPNQSGVFKDYDFSLVYRFDYTKSIGIGVGKLSEDLRKTLDGDSKKNLNYHIDFKFEKKYDNLLDIFINK
ncbi:hypothetical protein [Fusobacterium sp.]|uniref:hypothetical protein n=1 Tax=Fusobacterium sp. TaxID=68766 RepID=UPI000C6FD230|nr:hypothetical protein [Fusobacterium sp.]